MIETNKQKGLAKCRYGGGSGIGGDFIYNTFKCETWGVHEEEVGVAEMSSTSRFDPEGEEERRVPVVTFT
jgi:hypothetical protein